MIGWILNAGGFRSGGFWSWVDFDSIPFVSYFFRFSFPNKLLTFFLYIKQFNLKKMFCWFFLYRGRQAVGARGPNLRFPKSSRAAVLVLVIYKYSFGFRFSYTIKSFNFTDYIILINFKLHLECLLIIWIIIEKKN